MQKNKNAQKEKKVILSLQLLFTIKTYQYTVKRAKKLDEHSYGSSLINYVLNIIRPDRVVSRFAVINLLGFTRGDTIHYLYTKLWPDLTLPSS